MTITVEFNPVIPLIGTEPPVVLDNQMLLSGDQQTGADLLLLSGDQQTGTDVLEHSGDTRE